VICAIAATAAQSWKASRARTAIAKRNGTSAIEYTHEETNDTTRYLVLLPAGATATAHAPGAHPQPVPMRDGVLALIVHHRTIVTTQIGDHRQTTELVASHAQSTPAAVNPANPPSSATSTSAVESG
jgi:hypothetical protein